MSRFFSISDFLVFELTATTLPITIKEESFYIFSWEWGATATKTSSGTRLEIPTKKKIINDLFLLNYFLFGALRDRLEHLRYG
jgi:hypothetical protein